MTSLASTLNRMMMTGGVRSDIVNVLAALSMNVPLSASERGAVVETVLRLYMVDADVQELVLRVLAFDSWEDAGDDACNVFSAKVRRCSRRRRRQRLPKRPHCGPPIRFFNVYEALTYQSPLWRIVRQLLAPV